VARSLVVRAGRALVGYVCLWEIGHEIHITNLAVHPRHRRRGVAQALLRAVLDRCRQAGAELAFLEVRPTNTEALSLYERFGFYAPRHDGDFNGFILVRGEAAKLDALQRSEEFIKLTVRAIVCLDGFGVIDAHIGADVQRRMQLWTAALPK